MLNMKTKKSFFCAVTAEPSDVFPQCMASAVSPASCASDVTVTWTRREMTWSSVPHAVSLCVQSSAGTKRLIAAISVSVFALGLFWTHIAVLSV